MSPSNEIDRPDAVLAVTKQYLRRERPLSGLVPTLVVVCILGTYLSASLIPALVVGAILTVVVRAPLFESHGSFSCVTEREAESVIESFGGPTPPILAFQWGLADEITTSDDTTTYHISYLFGLRSTTVTVQTTVETVSDDESRITSVVETGGKPWATYRSTVATTDGQTTVDIEYSADRRFGLRRVPQQMIAQRYRDEILDVQGYTVLDRDAHFGV